MNRYKSLKSQVFEKENYKIVPIRYEDRFDIMNWRNEQMYHLRQNSLLTSNEQELYFKKVVNKLFEKETPNQILFSYLKDDKCIGYGGLVHINWIDKNAEISFVMETILEREQFSRHWENYLSLLELVAFNDLNLYKIYTYAFDIRPKLYPVLEKMGFKEEARLRKHCFIENNYLDVMIHSKFNK